MIKYINIIRLNMTTKVVCMSEIECDNANENAQWNNRNKKHGSNQLSKLLIQIVN